MDTDNAALQVHLAEYKKLEDEIADRSRAQHALLALSVTVLGVIVAAAFTSHKAEVMLVLPFVDSFVAFEWSSHDRQNCKLGRYVEKSLRPKLQALTHHDNLLEWECAGKSWRTSTGGHRIVALLSHFVLLGGGMVAGLVGARFAHPQGTLAYYYNCVWWAALALAVVSYVTSLPNYWIALWKPAARH